MVNYDNLSFKNVRKMYKEKSLLLSNISSDLENLRNSDDAFLKRYIEISTLLIANGLNIDMALEMEDEEYANFVVLAEEACELIQMSPLVRQYVALKEYGRMLVHETKHLEDVLMQLEVEVKEK